jgi:iron complex outermembrane receptor protein
LYADGPHIGTNAYEVGDSALDNELSNGVDITLRHRGNRISSEVTVFANQFDGYIYENPTGQEEDELPVYAFVQRDARLHGAEARAVFHLHNDEHGHLDLTVGGDLVRARNTTDRTDLPRTTPARLHAALDWHRGSWRAGTTVRHVFEQERLAPEEIGTDSHTLWSVYAGYRWFSDHGTWDFLIQGKNLTDADARVHSSFLKDVVPLAGRSIDVSLRFTF